MPEHKSCKFDPTQSTIIIASIILLLCLLLIVPSVFSLHTVDSLRDLYSAWEIHSGVRFPLQGPRMASSVHLGPIWFYLLNIPLAIFPASVSVSVFVAILASLKYPLAYQTGKILVDKRFGLMWAVCLAIPGWSSMQKLTYTHTSLVETLFFSSLLVLIKVVESNRPVYLVLLGLTFSLALHAHPTLIVLAPIILMVLMIRQSIAKFSGWVWGLALIASALPFLPYIIQQGMLRGTDIKGFSRYTGSEFLLSNALVIPDLLYSALYRGAMVMFETNMDEVPTLMIKVCFTLWLIYLTVRTVSLFKSASKQTRQCLYFSALGLLFCVTLVALLRSRTPWYMAYVFVPFSAAIIAAGVRTSVRLNPRRLMLHIGFIVFLDFSVTSGLIAKVNSGLFAFQGAVLHDVAQTISSLGEPGVGLPSLYGSINGRFLCEQQPIVLHAALALLVDQQFAIDALLECNKNDGIFLGGADSKRPYLHMVGLPKVFWTTLDVVPSEWMGPIGLLEASSVYSNNKVLPMEKRFHVPLSTSRALRQYTLNFLTPSNQALVVSNPLTFRSQTGLKLIEVLGNQHSLKARVRVLGSQAFLCSACDNNQSINWRITYQAIDKAAIDVVSIATI